MNKFRDPFLEHRKRQEAAHTVRVKDRADPMASLVTVEMNITELCNRTCVFCPRADPKVYPNRNLMMGLDVARKVGSDLASFDYRGRVSFSGFGECLLNKNFEDYIRIFRAALPSNTIETNTNGDRLTVERIHSLFAAGISAIYVNLYDGPEQAPHFEQLFTEAGIPKDKWQLRPHWPDYARDFGLTLNNRSGMVDPVAGVSPSATPPLLQRCHYPFYKMFVDWNGDILFCSNDWGREIVIGNVQKEHLRDLWLSDKMIEIRRALSNKQRSQSPCNKCDVDGRLHGSHSYNLLVSHYQGSGERGFDTAEVSSAEVAEAAS